jgi:hypothetical protein
MPPIDDREFIDRIASAALGVPAQAAAPQEAAAQVAEAAKKAAEETVEAAAPETEADNQAEPAVVYEVDFDGQKRKFTPEQIKGTISRYAALNQRHATLKPVIQVAEELMEKSGRSSTDVARFIIQALKAATKNPTMGGKDNKVEKPAEPAADIEDALTAWEQENAASLPPGYREMSKTMQQLAEGQRALQQMIQSVLATARGTADAAGAINADSRARQIQAARQTISNNLTRAQQQLQLPDEAVNDFITFATERGYTMEDFLDPDLTLRVVTDFKNAMNSPEMMRLRAIAEKRQAYTGSLGSTPATQGSAPVTAKEPTPLERLTTIAMQRRGIG